MENNKDKKTKTKVVKLIGLDSRKIAVQVLIQIETKGAYAKPAIAEAFKNKSISERDRAFITALVQGVVRNQASLDDVISKFSKQPMNKMSAALRNILRIGIFQIDHMSDIPVSAVVNTSVELANVLGHAGLAKFTNGVLRTYLRKRTTGETNTSQDPQNSDALSQRFSMPEWLITKWLDRWGIEETVLLLEDCQKIPPLTVRVCHSSITTEGLIQVFKNKGISIENGKLVDSCLNITNRGTCKGPVEKLPGYSEGLFTIQDEAAAFVSKVVDPKAGDLIIDLCAAPGGKSLHLGELMENKGRVVAIDSSESRLKFLKQNRQRIGLTNIEVEIADGKSYTSPALADKVLIDAPCSGTGVISRRSDIRLHRKPPDLVHLVQLQKDLLSNASKLVKPGGILVYSTCSIESEENEDIIKWFLETFTNFQIESLEPYLPTTLVEEWKKKDLNKDLDLSSGCLQLLPSRHNQSGFFICRLTRTI